MLLWRKCEAVDRDAFEDWTNGEFMSGQQYEGWDNMMSYEKRDTQQIDDVLDKAVLKKGVVVTRLAGSSLALGHGSRLKDDGSSLKRLQKQKGKIVLQKGCMSTGAAAEGLTIGQSGKNCEYHIHIPPSKGAGMWIGDSRINGWDRRQREFITNRDSYFRLGDASWDAGRKKYVIDVYWEGRDQHDYGTTGRLTNY